MKNISNKSALSIDFSCKVKINLLLSIIYFPEDLLLSITYFPG